MDKKILDGLRSMEYEHPWDQEALEKLKSISGLDTVVKKFNQYSVEKFLRAEFTGSSIKVNKKNFPELHEQLINACNILGVFPVPDLYIKWDYGINAFTTGVERTFIVIHSGIIDLLSEDEASFIIGHELGHIKSQHVLYHQMASIFPHIGEILGQATLGLGAIVAAGLEVALLKWARMSEFTADRAGLLACQNFNAACSAFIKMSGLPKKYYDRIDVGSFLEQAQEFAEYDHSLLDSLAKKLINVWQDHPWSVLRVSELNKWCEAGQYSAVIDRQYKDSVFCCPYCRHPIQKTDYYCPNCGNRIIIA